MEEIRRHAAAYKQGKALAVARRERWPVTKRRLFNALDAYAEAFVAEDTRAEAEIRRDEVALSIGGPADGDSIKEAPAVLVYSVTSSGHVLRQAWGHDGRLIAPMGSVVRAPEEMSDDVIAADIIELATHAIETSFRRPR